MWDAAPTWQCYFGAGAEQFRSEDILIFMGWRIGQEMSKVIQFNRFNEMSNMHWNEGKIVSQGTASASFCDSALIFGLYGTKLNEPNREADTQSSRALACFPAQSIVEK